MNLKSMSIDKLTKLRDQVDIALRSQVADDGGLWKPSSQSSRDFRLPNHVPKGSGSARAARLPRNTAIRKIRARPGPAAD